MPQLDIITFQFQIIGTLLTFFILFLYVIWIFIPFFFINIKLKFNFFFYFFFQNLKCNIIIRKKLNLILFIYKNILTNIIYIFKLLKIKKILKEKIYIIFFINFIFINFFKKLKIKELLILDLKNKIKKKKLLFYNNESKINDNFFKNIIIFDVI